MERCGRGGGVGDVSELTRCPGLGGNLSTIPRYTACRIRSCDTQTIPTCIVSILMTPGFYSFQAFAASRAYADHERKVRSRPTPPPPPLLIPRRLNLPLTSDRMANPTTPVSPGHGHS